MDRHAFSIALVRRAGATLRERTGAILSRTKNDDPKDIVTDDDLDVSAFMTASIRDAYPGEAIYSEETPIEECSALWVIDPIDGTANFSRSIPHYAVTLAFVEEGSAVAGAVYNPITDELFSFARGEGAFLNESTRLSVSPRSALKDMTVFFRAGRKPGLATWGGRSYTALLENVWKVNGYGSASLDTCFVAAGRIEACIYGTFSALDSAPALGILREAGGAAIDERGAPLGLTRDPQTVFIANSHETAETLRALIGQPT